MSTQERHNTAPAPAPAEAEWRSSQVRPRFLQDLLRLCVDGQTATEKSAALIGTIAVSMVALSHLARLLRRKKLAAELERRSAELVQQVSGAFRRVQPLNRRDRNLADYLLMHSNAPARYLLRNSLWAINLRYGERVLLPILTIGFNARDFKLIDSCLAQLTPDELHSGSDTWLQRLTSGDVKFTKDLSEWLGNRLVRRLEQITKAGESGATLFVERVGVLLSELLKNGGVEHVGKIAAALTLMAPENATLLSVYGRCAKWMGNLEQSRDLLKRALELPNCNPMAYFELAEVLEFLGDDKGAIEVARKGHARFSVEELFIKNPGCLTMLAGPLMRQGDLVAGWQQYQKRRDRFVFAAPPSTEIWRGEKLQDETLLMLSEKGIGDEIRYASCYPDLLTRVANVAVSADPRLVPLLERSFPGITFIPATRDAVRNWKQKGLGRERFRLSRALNLDLYCLATQFDYLCMAGDLPLYLRRERAAFPRYSGYLVPDPAKREEWRAKLAELGRGLKVGFTWRSASQTYRRDQHYFAVEQLLPVLRMQGVHFVNLQYDECEAELVLLEREHGVAVHRWEGADLKNDLDGVAALVKELDLVIAPHTMVKELAGAVGTPTLFMVPTGQAWVRWRANPETQEDIWHPSVIHVQSERAGDKDDVIARTAARLKAAADANGILPDWHACAAGLRRVASKAGLDSAATPAIEEKLPPNEFGEIYAPAGKDQIPESWERQQEWAKRSETFRNACMLLMRGVKQPSKPKGVLLICGQGSQKQRALTVYGMRGLLERGWAVAAIDEPAYFLGRSPNAAIAYFHEALIDGSAKRCYRHRDWPKDQLQFAWEVNWDERICCAEGINFYGIIANRLGKEFRRYMVDSEHPNVAARLETLIKTCDAALRVCLDAEERLAPRGLPVRFTGFEPNYPATGVFKVYCSERGWRYGIEFVEIRQAYEKYFRAGRSGFVNAIEVQNVTRHRLYSASGVRGDQFETWLQRGGKDQAVAKRGEAWVTQSRSGHHEPTLEGKIVLERIRRHRARGGKVACLYGCIAYDFGHPWLDAGPAHRDLVDWYNHTVKTLNDTGVMLLVKPHPSEADFEQFGHPDEFFVEMLEVPTAKNVSLLGHRWLNNADLIPHLDFGITWRGTIGTELALMGVPVVVCGRYFMTDQVLRFPTPRDRADYEHMLLHPERIQLTEELRQRSARIFEFYRTECMIDYPFGWISSKRSEAGPPVLSLGAIEAYLAKGHPSVEKISQAIT